MRRVAIVMLALGAGFVFRASLGEDLGLLLEQAASLKAEARWEECLSTLEKVVARASEDAAKAALAQCRIGETYVAMAMPEKAEEALLTVEREFPRETETVHWARVALLDALAFQGKGAEALEVFRRIEEAFAQGSASPLQYAWAAEKAAGIHARAGETEAAEALYEKVEALPIDDPGPKMAARVGRSEILISQNRFWMAIAPLRALLEGASGPYAHCRNWARVRLAECLYQTSLYAEALSVASEALDPRDPSPSPEQEAHLRLWKARSLVIAYKFPEACEALDPARNLKVPPQLRYDVLSYLGELWRRRGDFEHALDPTAPEWRKSSERAVPYLVEAIELAGKCGLGNASHARLELASALKTLGRGEEAAAWLRLGIADPSRLSPRDLSLARRIGDCLSEEKAEAWYLYLLEPLRREDPTEDLAEAQFGSRPPRASGGAQAERWRVLLWLGDHYRGRGEVEEAIRCYGEAEASAPGTLERGEAALGLVECYAAQGEKAEADSEKKLSFEKAREAAHRVVESWVASALEDPPANAHAAMEGAIEAYERAGLPGEATGLAELLAGQLLQDAPASKRAFAELQLLHVYGRRGLPPDTLARMAEELWERYKGSEEPDVREICASALVWGVHYYLAAGARADALRALDELEAAFPGKYAWHVQGYRRQLTEAAGDR